MSHLEWFPLYVGRLLGSAKVRRMDATEFGIYMALLVEEWRAGGSLPEDHGELAFLGRAEWREVHTILKRCFEKTDDGWQNETMEMIRVEQAERHRRRVEAGRKGGRTKGDRS